METLKLKEIEQMSFFPRMTVLPRLLLPCQKKSCKSVVTSQYQKRNDRFYAFPALPHTTQITVDHIKILCFHSQKIF